MKKSILISDIAMLVVIAGFFGVKHIYSGPEDCDPNDYLVGGEAYVSGPEFEKCFVSFYVYHYTSEIKVGEVIWVNFKLRDSVIWSHEMMGFIDFHGLCSEYGVATDIYPPGEEEIKQYNVYFTCGHSGNDGRDPNNGNYLLTIYDDCTYDWEDPPSP